MKFTPIAIGAVTATATTTAASFAIFTSVVDGFSTTQRPTLSSSSSSSQRTTTSNLFMASVAEKKVYTPEPVNSNGRDFPRPSSGRSYAEEEELTYISVEEAEERLRHERMQFDLDHEDMIRLIQEQRHELDELHHRAEQQQLRSAGSKQDHRVRVTRDIIPNDKQNNEDVVLDVEAVDDDQSSSTGSSSSKQSNTEGRRRHGHGHGPPPPSPQSHFHHQHRPQPHVRKPFMQPDAAFVTGESFGDLTPPMMSYHEVHIMDLERRLHLALEENAMLMEQLLTQRHMYDDERAELEQRIMEEQERVLSLQEELTMERTYFQQAQVELQDLVDTQRKRADRLQDELMIREMQDQQRMFQHQQQHYQHQNGGNTRTHYTQSGAAAASAESHHHHHRGGGAGNGVYVGSADPHDRFNIQLDMNDIRSPLFP